MQAVQSTAFGVDRRFGRVQVLWNLPLIQRPAAECDDGPAVARDRNHQAVSEAVGNSSVITLHNEPAGQLAGKWHLLIGKSRGQRLAAACRSIAVSKRANRLLRQPAHFELTKRSTAGGRRQLFAIER